MFLYLNIHKLKKYLKDTFNIILKSIFNDPQNVKLQFYKEQR